MDFLIEVFELECGDKQFSIYNIEEGQYVFLDIFYESEIGNDFKDICYNYHESNDIDISFERDDEILLSDDQVINAHPSFDEIEEDYNDYDDEEED